MGKEYPEILKAVNEIWDYMSGERPPTIIESIDKMVYYFNHEGEFSKKQRKEINTRLSKIITISAMNSPRRRVRLASRK